MTQFIGFGSGIDGIIALSGTDTPVDSSCSGTIGSTSLTATNASFAANQLILIIQMRGTGVGAWEVNQITSYTVGTITTTLPLANTYTDSGASQAQVIKLPQYSGVSISGTLTAKAWNGNTGGIIAFFCNGKVDIANNIVGDGKGFAGGASSAIIGNTGEGTVGSSTTGISPNGSGGGGGVKAPDSGHVEGGHGGGGGHAVSGIDGIDRNASSAGQGGSPSGAANLITMTMGGGGGGGGGNFSGSQSGQDGGAGGGIIMIFCRDFISTSTISVNGIVGAASDNEGGAAGGGAGGSIFIKAVSVSGLNNIVSTGGAGGVCTGAFNGNGGAGAVGRIRIETCKVTDATDSNPASSKIAGGFSFCGSATQII